MSWTKLGESTYIDKKGKEWTVISFQALTTTGADNALPAVAGKRGVFGGFHLANGNSSSANGFRVHGDDSQTNLKIDILVPAASDFEMLPDEGFEIFADDDDGISFDAATNSFHGVAYVRYEANAA